jgi:hypothetical protein
MGRYSLVSQSDPEGHSLDIPPDLDDHSRKAAQIQGKQRVGIFVGINILL